jgi:hypothetical protein
LVGAQRDLNLVESRAGHGQHQRRRIAEIPDELDRTRSVRQVVYRRELEAMSSENRVGVLGVFLELDVDEADAVRVVERTALT